MADTPAVAILYRETKVVSIHDDVEIVNDAPEGITVRYTYRKGKRLEFIPRAKLESIIYSDEKPARKPRKAKVAKPETVAASKPTPEPVEEPEEEPVVLEEDTDDDGIFSETEDFDDSGDDFDDDFEDD